MKLVLEARGGVRSSSSTSSSARSISSARKELRLREPGIAENTLDLPLARLYRNLADAARDIEDEIFKAEVQEAARRVEGMRVGIGEFLGQSREDHVYWIERNEKRDTHLTLTAAPIDVAPAIAQAASSAPTTPRS